MSKQTKEIVPKVFLREEGDGMFEVIGCDYFSFLKKYYDDVEERGVTFFGIVFDLVNDLLPNNADFRYFRVVNIDDLSEKYKQRLMDEDQWYVNGQIDKGYVVCHITKEKMNPNNPTTYVPRKT